MAGSSEIVDLLIRADFLFPMTGTPPPSGELPVVTGGEVAIRGDRIVYAGPARASGAWRAVRSMDARGHAVLPGFVNAHCHANSVVFRSQTDDPPGGITLYTIGFRGEPRLSTEEWHDLAGVGAIDMVKAGFTTLNDFYFAPDGIAAAVEAVGLRAQICDEIFDVAKEKLADGDYRRFPAQGEARLKSSLAFADRWHGKAGGRITTRLGPHAVDTCGPELHKAVAAEARRRGIGLHIHAAQSAREVEVVRAMFGVSSLEHLAALGVLGPDVVLAHMTFAGAGDLDAVRASGARYAHCSTIYPRRGVYPDVAGIRGRGIPTGLATDWMMNDPFEAMRNLINALRLRSGRVEAMSTAEALWLATMGSARVLGLDREIGSLEAGKKADLILVHLERAHLEPFYGDPASLVYYARAADVVASIVDGRVVMEDRRVLGMDETATLARARRHLPRFGALMRELGGVSRLPVCPCGMN